MSAVVKRSTTSGARTRLEWLQAHRIPREAWLHALQAMRAGEHVAPWMGDDVADWTEDESLALSVDTLEVACALARLLRRPGSFSMIWADPRLTGEKREPGKVTELGSRRFASPRRKRRCMRLDSDLDHDWHQHAVNSGGND